jgi:anaerobic dimethyl sulfoxide reductase subunit B (iron-sulfur subunit)
MQKGFYFDQSRCTGCSTCSVACKDWHNIDAGPASWRRVTTLEQGKYPKVFVTFLSLSCVHCAHPPCLAACPAGAITKQQEDGIVVVDRGACLGKERCGMACALACPYDAPQFEADDNAKMQMCDLCLERWQEGRKPVCVDACPMRALDAGPVADLRARYGEVREVEGFIYRAEVGPSVHFKPRQREPG